MSNTHIIAVSAVLIFSGISIDAHADGPFGVNKGMPISELSDCTSPTPEGGLYFCEKLPRMHPDLGGYNVSAYPQTGVCRVAATRKIEDEEDLPEIRKLFESIKSNLDETYGEPTSEKNDSDEVFDVKHSYT